MPLMNFRVDDEMKAQIAAEAKKMPYRTVSEYLREVVADAIKKGAKKGKAA